MCKYFGQKIRLCKFFDKSHVCKWCRHRYINRYWHWYRWWRQQCTNPCRIWQQQWQTPNNSNYQFVNELGWANTYLITKSHDLLVLVHWETHKPDFTILRENVEWLIRLKRRFETLKPILCMTVTLFSAIFWSGSADKGFFSTRPTWRSCQCQVCPIFFVSLSRWWIQFPVYIFKSNLYLAWLPTDYGVLTRLGEDEVAKPATTVHIVSEYIMGITF